MPNEILPTIVVWVAALLTLSTSVQEALVFHSVLSMCFLFRVVDKHLDDIYFWRMLSTATIHFKKDSFFWVTVNWSRRLYNLTHFDYFLCYVKSQVYKNKPKTRWTWKQNPSRNIGAIYTSGNAKPRQWELPKPGSANAMKGRSHFYDIMIKS